jgi:hypothetical protein
MTPQPTTLDKQQQEGLDQVDMLITKLSVSNVILFTVNSLIAQGV